MASNNNSINWNRIFDGNSSRPTARNSSMDQYLSNQENDPTPPLRNNVQPLATQRMPSNQAEDMTQPSTPQQRPPVMDEDVTPPMDREGPPPVFDRDYVPGYMTSLIGRYIRAEFVFSNAFLDKAGTLREVGVNYFVLEDLNGTLIMCDLYSVRFVNVLR